jgi:methylated-DNA-[protein]-cysteine S-methyltransferase
MERHLRYTTEKTPWGYIGMVASDTGLVRLTLPCKREQDALAEIAEDLTGYAILDPAPFADLLPRIISYLEGAPADFSDVALDMSRSTPFRRRVMNAVRSIPRGKVMSYRQVASKAGRPLAARAVGATMAANPVCIIVPCHRVVGSDGALIGFGGGLAMKQRMLELEGARLAA